MREESEINAQHLVLSSWACDDAAGNAWSKFAGTVSSVLDILSESPRVSFDGDGLRELETPKSRALGRSVCWRDRPVTPPAVEGRWGRRQEVEADFLKVPVARTGRKGREGRRTLCSGARLGGWRGLRRKRGGQDGLNISETGNRIGRRTDHWMRQLGDFGDCSMSC